MESTALTWLGFGDSRAPTRAVIRPSIFLLLDEEHDQVWMVYIVMDPNDSNTVYTASTRVWKTTNDGATWKAVSATLDNTVVTAIEVARANSKCVYVGTEKGGFFASMDGGSTWSGDLRASILRHDHHAGGDTSEERQDGVCYGGGDRTPARLPIG